MPYYAIDPKKCKLYVCINFLRLMSRKIAKKPADLSVDL
jgi:hypothetical protein